MSDGKYPGSSTLQTIYCLSLSLIYLFIVMFIRMKASRYPLLLYTPYNTPKHTILHMLMGSLILPMGK